MSAKQRARALARHGALDVLSGFRDVTGRSSRAERQPRVHLLYLHAVPQQELPQLRRFVRMVRERHELVSYSRAVDLIQQGDVDRPTVALSFDDGFSSNVAAAALLRQEDVSACFFVPTGFVGCSDVQSARAFFGMSEGVDEPAMTWRDLEQLLDAGHEIGNHTATHRVLSSLSSAEAVDEVGHAQEILKRRLGGVEHFAWPRGKFHHMSDVAAREVYLTGHVSCASAERGSHQGAPVGDRTCLRRDHLMTSWPLRHMRYFLSKGAETPVTQNWPLGWRV